jgi:transcriptional regulator with XRE-family HTH domain
MMDRLDWAALVRQARERRVAEGLSQRDLAALAGVSVPTVVKLEKGDTSIRVDVALAILATLGLAEGGPR